MNSLALVPSASDQVAAGPKLFALEGEVVASFVEVPRPPQLVEDRGQRVEPRVVHAELRLLVKEAHATGLASEPEGVSRGSEFRDGDAFMLGHDVIERQPTCDVPDRRAVTDERP